MTRGIAATAALVLLTAAVDGDAIPWPAGRAPTNPEIDAQIVDAFGRFDDARADELATANDSTVPSDWLHLDQTEIDAGAWSLDELDAVGAAIFEHRFRLEDGFGASDGRIHRVHNGGLGGPDAFACLDCHAQGGPGGPGRNTAATYLRGDGDAPASALIRSPPHVLGTGLVQALAREMSGDLAAQRTEAKQAAAEAGAPVTAPLSSKGVDFGELVAKPDGSLDTSAVEGVDADLVVRPFGWRGSFATLRRMAEDEARLHHGIQSHVLALRHLEDPDPAELGSGPDWFDPDADGIDHELDEGGLTALAIHLALLEVPVIVLPSDPGLRDRWASGSRLFDEIGCDACHRRELELDSEQWDEHPDTTDGPPVSIALLHDGDLPRGGDRVALFSDLRRHDMGDGLAEPNGPRGLRPAQFLTRPLWGLAESAPYLHDGRAATIPEAIEAHAGEAEAAAVAFAALSTSQRADLLVFLLSLSRAPNVRVQG